jgi:hypothetical protein
MTGGKAEVRMIDSVEETANPNQRLTVRRPEGSDDLLDVLAVQLAELQELVASLDWTERVAVLL